MSHNKVVGVHKAQNRKTGYAVATGTVNAVMNIWIGTVCHQQQARLIYISSFFLLLLLIMFTS
jgi:hypothetical protein